MSNKNKIARDYLKNAYDVKNVPKGTEYFINLLFNKLQELFIYENLPITCNKYAIEKSLILKGNGVIVKKNGTIYCPFNSSVFGFNYDDVPNQYVYANPIINGGSGVDMKDGVILWNSEIDKITRGSITLETITRYANLLAHTESTITNYLIYVRTLRNGVAPNQAIATAMDNVFNSQEVGDTKTLVNDLSMLEDINVLHYDTPNIRLNELTETRDYIFNCFYNEFGLQTLEEKKERFIESELEVDEEVLNNNIESLLDERIRNVNKINKFLGLKNDKKITVRLNEKVRC